MRFLGLARARIATARTRTCTISKLSIEHTQAIKLLSYGHRTGQSHGPNHFGIGTPRRLSHRSAAATASKQGPQYPSPNVLLQYTSARTISAANRSWPASRAPPFVRSVSSIPKSQGPTNVQHIRFVAPRRQSWFNRMVYAFIVIQLLRYAYRKDEETEATEIEEEASRVMKIQQEEEKQEDDGTDSDTSQEEEESEEMEIDADDLWFLPLTWPKKKERIPYKAKDPEWQEFIKLSKDQKEIAEIKSQAMKMTKQLASQSPNFVKSVGQWKKTTAWLEVDFPIWYSEGYEVTGFALTSHFLALARKDYDERTIKKFFNVVYPQALINAFWDVSKILLRGEETLAMKTQEHDKLPVSIPGIPDLDKTPNLHATVKQHSRALRTRPNLTSPPKGFVQVSGRIELIGTMARGQFFFIGLYSPKDKAWASLPGIYFIKLRPHRQAPGH